MTGRRRPTARGAQPGTRPDRDQPRGRAGQPPEVVDAPVGPAVDRTGPAGWPGPAHAGRQGAASVGPGDGPADEADEADDEPEVHRRLSLARAGVVGVVLVALAGAIGLVAVRMTAITPARAAAVAAVETWFAPYVDTTLTPYHQFQDPTQNPSRQVVLGFVVSDPAVPCTPSWGGFYDHEQAAEALSLDRRIAQMRASGGNVVVSFGGAANSELALTCPDATSLQGAYRSTIDRYALGTVDLDIEGAAVADTPSIQRRGQALAALQQEARAAGGDLAVWLTLPVSRDGLLPDAVALVAETLDAGVDLAGINVMTMNFGDAGRAGVVDGAPAPDGADDGRTDMARAVESALRATQAQVRTAYRDLGTDLSSDQAWAKVGATVMIGQNDLEGERFTVADAEVLRAFARAVRLGRLSMWSLNRDHPCGAAFVDVAILSNTCSGTAQTDLQFTNVLAASGEDAAAPAVVAPTTTSEPGGANDPYPVWQPAVTYSEGFRVVRDGMVHEAKWYSQNDDPDAVVAAPHLSPWQLIGPVLPTDRAPTTTTMPAGTYPEWSPDAAYASGARVLLDGRPFEARWYTQGASPEASLVEAATSPWSRLFTVPGEPPHAPRAAEANPGTTAQVNEG